MSAAFVCGVASAAMADELLPEVLLSSQSVTLPESSALLIRTVMTPSEVDLHLPIDMHNTVCVETAMIPKTGQSGLHCGYDRRVRRVCRNLPRECRIDPRTKREICAPQKQLCELEHYDVARTCTWLESQCVRSEIVKSSELRKLKLKFKKVAKLNAGEKEIYKLDGSQTRLDGSDAKFSLSPLSTKRAVKIKAKDGLLTGFADVITIKGD